MVQERDKVLAWIALNRLKRSLERQFKIAREKGDASASELERRIELVKKAMDNAG